MEMAPTASWRELSIALGDLSPTLARLSPAERLVAHYIVQGMSNAEIARALGKSVATVKHQVSSILGKLEVPSRGRLMALLSQKNEVCLT